MSFDFILYNGPVDAILWGLGFAVVCVLFFWTVHKLALGPRCKRSSPPGNSRILPEPYRDVAAEGAKLCGNDGFIIRGNNI